MQDLSYGTLQHYISIPLYTLVKFELWDKILTEPAPASDLLYPTGVWHYAREMAFVAKGQLRNAQGELEQLRAIAANPALDNVTIWDINKTAALLRIGSEVLAGEIAAGLGNVEQAIYNLKQAVELEDNLSYDEPAPWYSPVRQSLAAVLLQVGRPAEAEQVYRADLVIYPNNGWSLHGLAQSLSAQGKTREAQLFKEATHRSFFSQTPLKLWITEKPSESEDRFPGLRQKSTRIPTDWAALNSATTSEINRIRAGGILMVWAILW